MKARDHYGPSRLDYWNNNLSKWRKSQTNQYIISVAGNNIYKRMVTHPSGKRSASPMVDMKNKLPN